MIMNEKYEDLNPKLKIKEQWFCDYCGEIIESDKDGMLEWDTFLEGEREYTAENFRIVHHRRVKNCRPKHADDHLADGHLHWYTGPYGLSELLSIQTRYKLDIVKFNNIIRRLHVDLYEEAKEYIQQAKEDGYYEIDPYDIGDLSERDMIWLIRKYGKQHV
jgi:hypothetical protein